MDKCNVCRRKSTGRCKICNNEAVRLINVLSTSHNPKVVSSSLTPATKAYITRTVTVLVIFCCLKIGCNNA